MQAEDIEALIRAALPCEYLAIDGDGVHWQAVIVSTAFVGRSRVARQQVVLSPLKEHMASNRIHALSMTTLTPDEWRSQNG